MSQYAKNTSVTSELSRLEIEKILIRYGAQNFAYATSQGKSAIAFTMNNRQIRFILTMPAIEEYDKTPTGRKRTENSKFEAWEQACRQRWRALKLVVQAKLEAVESGISEFDDEFLANIVLPDNSTVGDFIRPQVDRAYLTGEPPKPYIALMGETSYE